SIRIIVVAGQRSVADRLYGLQCVQPCFLRAAALPLVGGGIDDRDIGPRAGAELATVEACERATCRVAAERLRHRRTDFLLRARREEFDCAAKIAQRRGIDGTRAL